MWASSVARAAEISLSRIMPVRAMPRDSRMLRFAIQAASSQPMEGE